ncbi:transposase [Enterococcus faecium]|uniref:transposase n=1 Tax=Enterococcus faecium TaxID=1352 RepID=UPI003D344D90
MTSINKLFLSCTNPEEVEFLVTDMNAAYFQLTKRVLPNAKVVIDRLLGFSTPLKEAYPFFHELVEAFRDKDPDLFFSLLTKSH